MTDRYEPHCDCLGGHVSMRPDPNGRWRRVEVKPLEWKAMAFCGQPAFFAETEFGDWMVVAYLGRDGRWAYTDPSGQDSDDDWDAAAAAKAAAQADYERRILSAFVEPIRADEGWQDISTAPPGCITEDVGCRGVSEWFLGRPSPKYRSGRPPFIVIRRCAWPHEDAWECAGEARYVPAFFDAWAPITEADHA